MKSASTRFPSLGADADLADVQVRQTVAMGLVPLGVALLLMAAVAPAGPPAGLWIGAGLALGGMGLMWGLWRRSGHRYLRGYSTTHFLVRYLFLILCPYLLWVVFGGVIVEGAGWIPPAMLGVIFLLYPAGRILQERIGSDPENQPGIEMARIVCQQIQVALGILAFVWMLSGAIIDAQEGYPTDPTSLLLFLWLLALVAVLASGVMAYSHWERLYGKRSAPPSLDDLPPPGPKKEAVDFGSGRF